MKEWAALLTEKFFSFTESMTSETKIVLFIIAAIAIAEPGVREMAITGLLGYMKGEADGKAGAIQ